jgi:hypothetical protein
VEFIRRSLQRREIIAQRSRNGLFERALERTSLWDQWETLSSQAIMEMRRRSVN